MPSGRNRSELCDHPHEELASMLTHAFGVVASIVGLVCMVFVSGSDPWRVVAASVFGGTLVLLYTSSTVYHLVTGCRAKSFFQCLDHACIYLLIAGSYTPLTLVTLRGPWGWSLFGVVWFLAIAGVLVKTFLRRNRDHWISTLIYLVMGWLVVVAIGPVVRSLPPAGLALTVAGGLCYTAGVVFYAWDKLRFNHAIWHLFVLAGSTCHVLTTIFYILA